MKRRALLLALCVVACDAADDANDAFERMMQQKRADTWEPSPVFDNRQVMRPLPDGVVPVEKSLAEDVSETADFPAPITREQLRRGRERFDIYCAVCHGVTGNGVSVVANNLELRKPPSVVVPPVTRFAPGRLYRVIRDGYGFMPSYAHELPHADRWAVAAYVKALQVAAGSVPLASLPAPVQAEARQQLP